MIWFYKIWIVLYPIVKDWNIKSSHLGWPSKGLGWPSIGLGWPSIKGFEVRVLEE